MDQFPIVQSGNNIIKHHAIEHEKEVKKKGMTYLSKEDLAYLQYEYKMHLYMHMPQSVIGYSGNPKGNNMWTPWYQDMDDICWHCPPVSQDHLHMYALPVSEEYTTTKLAFGYKLIQDTSSSAFDTRLVPEQVWDKQIQDQRWCNKCSGNKFVAQSGWYPYHTWFKFCYGLFTRTNAFGMTDDVTKRVLSFLQWRSQDEHASGLRAAHHFACGKRKRELDAEREEIIREGQAALQRNWDRRQEDIVLHVDTNYVNRDQNN